LQTMHGSRLGSYESAFRAIVFVAIAIAAGFLAGSHPADFYADALRVDGRSTAFYSWIERDRPDAIGAVGLAIGAVNVLSPQTRTIDVPDENGCAVARVHDALLVALAQDDRSAGFNATRLRAARACGPRRFDDGIAVVTAPLGLR